MKAEQKKRIADLLLGLVEKPDWKRGVAYCELYRKACLIYFDKMGLDVFVRTYGEPLPKDTKSKVKIKLDGGPGRKYKQLWVDLDRDVALKILVLGFIPETISAQE